MQLQWKHQFEFAGYYMAKEKGFYKEAGLEVEIKEYKFGTDIINDVQNGTSTFGTSYPTIILKKSLGSDVVLLNSVLQSSPHVLISLESSGIRSIKDFKGKTLMINEDAANTASFVSMLNSKGVSFDDLTIVRHSFNIQDLIDGKVDITTAFRSNELYTLDKLGIKYRIWDPKDFGFDLYDVIEFTSGKFLKENCTSVLNFNEASKKGWLYAFNNIEETVNVILKKYNSQNRSKEALTYEADVLKKLAFDEQGEFGTIDKNKIQRIYDIYNILGLTKNTIDLDKFIFDRYKLILNEKEKKYLEDKKLLKFCVDPNWMPYEKIQNGKYTGIGSDYIKLFEEKLNIPFELIVTQSWNQSKQKAKNRECDILPLSSGGEKRKSFMNVTKFYLKEPLVLATNMKEKFINDFKTINKKAIAMTEGYSIVQRIKNKYPNITVIETSGIDESLKLVNKGKAYGCIDAISAINYHIQKSYPGRLKISSKLEYQYKLGMASNKDEPLLHKILTKAVNSISQKEHKKIYDKWNSSDIKIIEKIDYTLLYKISLLIAIVLIFLIYRHYILKRSNLELNKKVKEKTKELQRYNSELEKAQKELELLNKNLENRVKEEVAKNRTHELKIMEQSKNAAMGNMIGNIAHQWRQPLSVISTAASGIQIHKELGILKDELLDHTLVEIENSAQYLSKTIDTFRDFIKEDKVLKEVVLQERINKALEIVQTALRNNHIKLINNINDIEPVKISLVAGELSQVIINIVNNAKDAIIENGINDPWVKVDLEKSADKVLITIEDNGGGIPQEILPKIFEVYFTTKHESQGTGLGLHMSYKIITESLKGRLWVENTGNGAVFFIELPLNNF